MDDKNNELRPDGGSSPEALSRAERIKAIKNAIRSSSQQNEASGEAKENAEEIPAEDNFTESSTAAAPAQSADNSWEDELAARIARRVQKVKAEKDASAQQTPESILAELDSSDSFVEEEECSDEEIVGAVGEETPEDPAESVQNESASQETGEAEAVPKTAKKNKKKKNRNLKESLLGLLPQKKDSVGERIRKIVFLGSCVAIIVCGYIVADYYIENAHTQKGYDEIAYIYSRPESVASVEEPEDEGEIYTLLPNAQRLLEINSEVAGFINIPGTQINYPVMQSDDLEKYLHLNIMGEEARAGALFLDYRNRFDHVVDGKLTEQDSDNLIIYGHNMANGMMFGELKNYRDNVNFYGEHPIIELNSNYACYTYKIFAFFIIDSQDTTETAFDCWNQLNFPDETAFYDFVNEAKRRTIRLNDVDVQYGDKLLTLSTCNGIFGNDGPGRLIVLARRVRDGEDPYEGTQNSTSNPNIKWPSLYYKYNANEKYDPNAEFVPYPYSDAPAEETTTNTEE